MKLLIDARSFARQPGGVGLYAYRFAKALLESGEAELSLVTDVTESEELRSLSERGVPVFAYGRAVGQGPSLSGYFVFLQKVLAEQRPELFWEVNNLLPFRPRLYGGHYVVTLHDLFPLTLPKLYPLPYRLYFRFGLRRTLRFCDAVLFDSDTVRREVNERFPSVQSKAQFVSFAIVPEPTEPAVRRGEDFLSLGSLERRKGTDLLLEAYRLYRQRGGKRGLILAGKQHDPGLRLPASDLPGLKYLGYVSDQARRELLQSCHALLFPSRGEGFGLPLLEALAFKMPALASRLPVFQELAGESAGYFDLSGGAEALCEEMLRDELPAAADPWVNPFTAERLTPGLLAFFRSLLKPTLRFDAQVLMDETPTGIGLLADATVRACAADGRFACSLHGFSLRRSGKQLARLASYGLPVQLCRRFPRGLYLRSWRFLPLPHSLFFPRKADLNVFFNYDLPPGVKGRSLVYIHDLSCLRCPETMDRTVLRLLRRNLRGVCRRADRILTLSNFSREELSSCLGISEEKIRVIPCGVDHSLFHPLEDVTALQKLREKYGIDGDYFLYAGTLEPRKNIALLLKAYAKLTQRGAQTPKLVLAGKTGWKTEGVEALLQSDSLRGRVIRTGYVPREELPVLMGGALAFVFPSLYEGFGLPPLEAMACGTPVIVSDRASLPELAEGAGLIVPVETEDALCEAMRRVLNEPETRRLLSRHGIGRAAQFTWEQAGKALLEVCEELL